MKTGVIFFHKNCSTLYNRRWVEKCIDSILNQTFQNFQIYGIDYGGDSFSVFSGIEHDKKLHFYSEELDTHADAMNFILDVAFKDGCDIVFNTNIDDYYSSDRFSQQIEIMSIGYDLISSDFYYVKDFSDSELDVITNNIDVSKEGSIIESLEKNHNVIAHPCVAYSKKFWEGNRYKPEEIPAEDLFLWKRGINSDMKFYIIPEKLLFYRIHTNQISASPKKEKGQEIINIENNGDTVWFNDYNI